MNSKQYQFSDEAKYILGSDTLSLSSEIEYDKSGELLSLTIFKSEGALNYTKEDIIKDMKLLDFVDAKYKQNWSLINDTLLVNDTDTLKVETIEREYNKKVLINRKEDKTIIIFELD